ncbi:tetratricopeptide repeat protein [Alteriqipengyuania sp. WL0013]|uniref:tetratricopeptide repeat protein n=1 Tax=Alteriqipengyuania sp. WL0013 TaxID=3110773 RepID=UPI002C1FE67B|nr:tetratricopeptide repeat protein [Alteriqipengyuania sp. WL0013]MEB3415092.1 tetratricopeptide repeat protein [Alteriqipengyuania sp. WL0013]
MGSRALLFAALLCVAPTGLAAQGGEALRQAEAALVRGDAVSAKIALDQAASAGASAADLAALRGEAALMTGDMDEARKFLSPARLSGTYRVRGLRVLARLEQAEGNIPAAANALELALKAGGDKADIWTDVARLRYAAGNHAGAFEAIDYAAGLDDAGAGTLLYKAQLVRDAQGLRSSLPWFERAVELAPDDATALGEYAATLADMGRATDAVTVTRQILARDRRNAQAFFIQAVIAARAQKHGLARRLLSRAGDALENRPATLLVGGLLENRGGASRLATERLFDLFEIAPDVAAAELADALLVDGDGVELAARFEGGVAVRQASPALAWRLVRSAEQQGDVAGAATAFDTAAQWSWGGAVRRGSGAAIGRLAAASASSPGQIDTSASYIRALVAGRQPARALEVARDLGRRHPSNFDARLALGDAALASGNAAEAVEAYTAAAAIRRGPQLVRKLALANLDNGNAMAAKAVLADYIREYPLDRDVPTFLGTLMVREGDAGGAAALLKATWPEARRDPLGLSRLAWAQLYAGDGEAALRNAQTAYRMQRSSLPAAMVLAAALEQSGGSADTVRALRAKAGDLSVDEALRPLFAL